MHRKKTGNDTHTHTHRAVMLAHHQSENLMAQKSNSQPSQTLHVESEQTLSVPFQNLQNIFHVSSGQDVYIVVLKGMISYDVT